MQSLIEIGQDAGSYGLEWIGGGYLKGQVEDVGCQE